MKYNFFLLNLLILHEIQVSNKTPYLRLTKISTEGSHDAEWSADNTECNRENDETDEAEVQSCDVSNVITRGEVKYCWITVTSERECV